MKKHLAVISENVPASMADKLAAYFDILCLPPDKTISKPISSHPDMILSQIGDTLIVPESYYKEYPETVGCIVNYSGLRLTLSGAPRSAAYPLDVSLNAAVGENFVICRKDTCAPEILTCADALGYSIIHVKQGYAGCSCIITPAGIITSDKGICSAISSNVLYVTNSGIILPGYDIGFIGGCGGFCEGALYFFGDITASTAGKAISVFADKNGYKTVPLSPDLLTDFGGIKFFRNKTK